MIQEQNNVKYLRFIFVAVYFHMDRAVSTVILDVWPGIWSYILDTDRQQRLLHCVRLGQVYCGVDTVVRETKS